MNYNELEFLNEEYELIENGFRQGETHLTGRQSRGRLVVRLPGRDHDHPVETELPASLGQEDHVPDMGRVEGGAEHP